MKTVITQVNSGVGHASLLIKSPPALISYGKECWKINQAKCLKCRSHFTPAYN